MKVNPGVCGFETDIRTENAGDGMNVNIAVETACPTITKFVEDLGNPVPAFDVMGMSKNGALFEGKRGDYRGLHAACPVLSGMVKCVEVEMGMAVARDVSMTFVED